MADHDGRISSDAGDSSRHQVVELDHDIIDNDLSGWQEDEVAGKTVRYDENMASKLVKFLEIATTTLKYHISVDNGPISTIDSYNSTEILWWTTL